MQNSFWCWVLYANNGRQEWLWFTFQLGLPVHCSVGPTGNLDLFHFMLCSVYRVAQKPYFSSSVNKDHPFLDKQALKKKECSSIANSCKKQFVCQWVFDIKKWTILNPYKPIDIKVLHPLRYDITVLVCSRIAAVPVLEWATQLCDWQ